MKTNAKVSQEAREKGIKYNPRRFQSLNYRR